MSNKRRMPPFADLHKLPEDERIDLIGHYTMHETKTIGFVVEDDEKADRYIAKLKAKFPGIVVDARFPLAGQVCIRLKSSVPNN
jgi:hypothetical protein